MPVQLESLYQLGLIQLIPDNLVIVRQTVSVNITFGRLYNFMFRRNYSLLVFLAVRLLQKWFIEDIFSKYIHELLHRVLVSGNRTDITVDEHKKGQQGIAALTEPQMIAAMKNRSRNSYVPNHYPFSSENLVSFDSSKMLFMVL